MSQLIKKPELLATAGSIEEMNLLIDAGADAINMGTLKFGMRLQGDLQPNEMFEAIHQAHSKQAKVYVVMNNIMNNRILSEMPNYLTGLAKAGADAIVFGDPAILISMKQAGIRLPLHWNGEMTSTNYVSAEYWARQGAVRVIAARELNMEQVVEMKRKLAIEVQVQVHGITNIFHSKRRMVSNYRQHQGRDFSETDQALDKGLFIIEAERKDEKFPVYEDVNGTHIMSSEDICMLENLDELMSVQMDSFKVEGLLKSLEYNKAVVQVYRQVIDTYAMNPEDYHYNAQWLAPVECLQPKDRPFSFGFYFKEQVY